MFISLLLIVIPAIPVAALEWAIAMLIGVSTGFMRVTPMTAIVITILMILGSTSSLWAPFLGLKGRQMSCSGLLAFFIGSLFGTFLIPIPVLGTLLGGFIGVLIVEFAYARNLKTATDRSKVAIRVFIYGMILELVFAIGIVITTVVSVATTM